MKLNKKGFTLFELLAVLAILITILLVAIPSITSSLSRSEEKELNSKKELIASSVEISVSKNDCYYEDLKKSRCVFPVEDLLSSGWITEDMAKDSNGNILSGYVAFDDISNQYKFIDGSSTYRNCFTDACPD